MIAPWLAEWWQGCDTGLSSRTIAVALSGDTTLAQITARSGSAPRDTSDVGRCIRLLDLAESHGCRWRGRLSEVATVCPAWTPLVSVWAEVEAAYHEDVATQKAHEKARWTSKTGRSLKSPRKDIPFPLSRCWWLVATTASGYDPYADRNPHPFKGTHEP